MVKISDAVGPHRANKSADVKTVQALLNRNMVSLVPLKFLDLTGRFDAPSETAIRTFQERVVKMKTPDGVVSPNGPTLLALDSQSGTLPKNPPASQASQIIGGLSEEQFVEAARILKCEAAAIKAIVATELGIRSPFDEKNRPTILFERHYFSKLTFGKYNKSDPDISNPVPGGYGKFSEQYPKLERAQKLDNNAALQSASWGAFQIMGANYNAAGFSTVQDFVAAMQRSTKDQLSAFVSFISASGSLGKSLRNKEWEAFAKIYNGPSYKDNNYHTKMKDNYASFVAGTK